MAKIRSFLDDSECNLELLYEYLELLYEYSEL